MELVTRKAPSELAPLLEDVREEVGQMTVLLEEILQFTKAGLHSDLHPETVPLRELVLQALKQEDVPLASVDLQLPESLRARADRRYLLRAVGNVLRNAVRHAGAGTAIRIQGREGRSETVLFISDEGPGVPEAMVHRLVDPFFRTESARTRETGGVGLGLSIVKRCVESCGGTIHIRNLKPHGLCVEMHLPKESGSAP